MEEKRHWRDVLIDFARNFSVKMDVVNPLLRELGMAELRQGVKLYDLLLRPSISFDLLFPLFPELILVVADFPLDRRSEIIEAAEIMIKYSGYIERERGVADKIRRLEDIKIDGRFDYPSITSLSTEARQKLDRIRPATIAQASRIPGVSPSDINILLLLMGR